MSRAQDPPPPPEQPPSTSRRSLLRAAGLAATSAAIAGTGLVQIARRSGGPDTDHGPTAADTGTTASGDSGLAGATPPAPGSWSDPSSWSEGRVPGAHDVAVVERPVVLDVDAAVAGVEIRPGGRLRFAGEQSVTLSTSGNLVLEGELTMVPDGPEVVHVLRFVDIDEDRVQGGDAHHPVATDVGLWIVGDGVLHAEGHRRVGWNRTGNDPSWRSGDDVRVAPVDVGDHGNFSTFTAGGTVPTVVDHRGQAHATEVFNLTRNVRIEGTPGGRAHVIVLRAARPQTIRWVEIRHVGPVPPATGERRSRGPGGRTATGRYGLHFHHCGDGSRGSIVEGVVVRDCGSHAFVPHGSHGITFEDCIAFGVSQDAYWWDPEPDHGSYPANASHDTTYRHCAAFDLVPIGPARGFELTGFHLGQGEGNACIDCVTVGCRGLVNASGFHWPSSANGMPANTWEFTDCVAHNNARHGIFVWQNDSNPHLVERFAAWRNGGAGINHGAYLNRYEYRDLTLFENEVAIRSHAGGRGGGAISYTRVDSADQLHIVGHPVTFEGPVQVIDCEFSGPIVIDERVGDREGKPGLYEFVNTLIDGQPAGPEHFDLVAVAPGTRLHVRNGDLTFDLDDVASAAARPAAEVAGHRTGTAGGHHDGDLG